MSGSLIPRKHGSCAQCGTETMLDEMDFGPYRGQFICDNCYDDTEAKRDA